MGRQLDDFVATLRKHDPKLTRAALARQCRASFPYATSTAIASAVGVTRQAVDAAINAGLRRGRPRKPPSVQKRVRIPRALARRLDADAAAESATFSELVETILELWSELERQ
jgi:hypothetical protein